MQALRTRFGIPGVVSVIALVFAMLGGAYAANNTKRQHKKSQAGLNKKQKKQATNIAKREARRFQGSGPQGAQGPGGAQGAQGAKGDAGDDGVSVTSEEFGPTEEPLGEPCDERGGSKFVSATETTFSCNGDEGSPWSAGGTLPSGATETGAFNVANQGASLSFAIPLPEAIPVAKIVTITESSSAEDKEKCDNGGGPAGSATNPEAANGYLCLFPSVPFEAAPVAAFDPGNIIGAEGTGKTGVILTFEPAGEGQLSAFAVTAP